VFVQGVDEAIDVLTRAAVVQLKLQEPHAAELL
jgi:hypothetical protein